jgi:hypothetical protein
MSEKYYTSFVVPPCGEEAGLRYDGVVEVAEEVFASTFTVGAGLLARLVARNLAVQEDEVRVLEWQRLN